MAKKRNSLLRPLSPKQLRREMRAAGRIATRGEKRILQGERRTSRAQSRRIRDWFPQYQQQIDKAAERTGQAYQTADSQIAQSSQRANDFAEQMRQRLAAEAQSSANLRGVQYDGSGSLTSAQAQIARAGSADTLRNVTASQGASQAAYMQDKRRIAGREKIEQLLREQQRRRSYTNDLRALEQQKADMMLQERGRLRDSERNYHLGLLAARDRDADRRAARRENMRDRRASRRAAQRDRKFDRKHGGSGSSSGGGKGGNVDRHDVRTALALLNTTNPKKVNRLKRSGKLLDTILLADQSISPAEARRAIRKYMKSNKGKGKKAGGGAFVGGHASGNID